WRRRRHAAVARCGPAARRPGSGGATSGPPTSYQPRISSSAVLPAPDPAPTVTAWTATPRSTGLTIIAVLAVVQAAVGIFWAIRWFYLAGQLGERGALLLPLAGALVFLRAVFATIIALLYLAFV